MSMHKIPLTELEHDGLLAHRLPIGVPSQLSDVFRSGIKWANEHRIAELQAKAVPEKKKLPDVYLADYHEAIGWNACIDAMLAAAPAPAASPVVPETFAREFVKACRVIQKIAGCGHDATDTEIVEVVMPLARLWRQDDGHDEILKICCRIVATADAIPSADLSGGAA